MVKDNQPINAVLTCDENGIIITANKDCELLFRLKNKELLGLLMSDIIQLESVVNFPQHLATVYDASKMNACGKAILAKKIDHSMNIELLAWFIETDSNNVDKQSSHSYLCHLNVLPEIQKQAKTTDSKSSLIEIIDNLQRNSISEYGAHYVFGQALDALLNYTNSEYGFIGEILHNADNVPYLQTHAITNISWNSATEDFFQNSAPSGLSFFNNNTLFGQTVTKGEVVIANQPKEHPKSGGLPDGHPPLNHYLGLPIYCNNELVGMAGISNRPDGYNQELVDDLFFLMNFLGFLIKSYQKDRERKFFESKIQIQSKELSSKVKALISSEKKLKEEIARREQVENQLIDRESNLEEAQRIACIGSWTLDIASGNLEWSEELFNMFGFDPKQPIPPYSEHQKLFTAGSWDKLSTALDKTVNEGTPYELVLNTVRNDGTNGWMWVSGEAVRNTQGVIDIVHGVAQDITEKKLSEQRLTTAKVKAEQDATMLRLSKVDLELHKSAMDTHTLVSWTDVNGIITYVNQKFCDVSGYTKDELIGANHNLLNSGNQTKKYWREMYQICSKGETWHDEIRNKHKLGSYYWVETTIVPIFDKDKISGYMSIRTDITKQKDHERELRENQSKLTHHVQNTPLGCISWDTNFLCTEWNKSAEDMFGYTAEEAIGQHACKLIVATELSGFVNDVFKSLLTKEGGTRSSNENITKNGHILKCDWYNTAIIDENNQVTGITSLIQDNTQRERQEEQLRRSQKMDTLGQLSAGIAHDFNNILGIVSGNLELLQMSLPSQSKEYQRTETALKGTKRAASITRKLLNFSRKDSHNVLPTNMNDFITSNIDLIKKSLTPSVQLNTNLSKKLWMTEVDQGDLEDALLNISLNAHDAMPDGGILTITTSNQIRNNWITDSTRLSNSTKNNSDFVMISISDNGIGMDEEVVGKILEPFFTTKDKNKGTGLGLSMVHGFVERSGGHIEVKSMINEGTMFTIFLPRLKEQDKLNSSLSDDLQYPRGSETVLVVDDEEALKEVAKQILTDLGYTVLTASSGYEALKILETGTQVDLLFSDVVMQGELDGYKLAITAHKLQPELNILLTSGYINKQRTELSDNNEYISTLLDKPYSRHELAVAIRKTFDG
jgi:PAS domain S-box-containing protein